MNFKRKIEFYKHFLLKSATIGVSLGRPNQIIKGGSIHRTDDTRGELTSAIFKEKKTKLQLRRFTDKQTGSVD